MRLVLYFRWHNERYGQYTLRPPIIALLQFLQSLDRSCNCPSSKATESRDADIGFHNQDLPAIPLDVHPDRIAIKERMMKRGARLQYLANSGELQAYTRQPSAAPYSLRKSPKAFVHRVRSPTTSHEHPTNYHTAGKW